MWDICRDSTTGTFPTISQEFDDEGFMFYKHQLSAELITTELVMLSKHLTLNCSLLLLASIFPSIRVFSNESTLRMRWPKYWSFSFSIIPSKEIPGLISFRMDWFHGLLTSNKDAKGAWRDNAHQNVFPMKRT